MMVKARKAWSRLVAFGFRLLYNELAWTYDTVSWAVSFGLWRRWQAAALGYLPPAGSPPGHILEVGFGPGHLLVGMAAAGYHVAGLDASRAMLAQARRNTRRAGVGAATLLCLGRAQALPFAPQTFAAVVLTFPAPFVYDPAWIRGLVRVLKPGGRVIVVETATPAAQESGQPGPAIRALEGLYSLTGQRGPAIRALEGLYSLTGQRGPGPDLAALLAEAGLETRRVGVRVEETVANLVIGEWGAASYELAASGR